jgi:ABC-2 type transport system ATP-binding protein
MTVTAPFSPAIAVTGLRKSYGEQTVLDGIDLNIAAGTIFSLLGPNGAGKTTAVQILTTLVRADAARDAPSSFCQSPTNGLEISRR